VFDNAEYIVFENLDYIDYMNGSQIQTVLFLVWYVCFCFVLKFSFLF